VSPDELDSSRTAAGGGESPRDWEREDEQSGLLPLLRQMSLAELREIAHLRDWRVAGTGKADYVAALATLLCDPTETARAVTTMPESLREALRAAFVVDDGTGITATALAQTMTALRSAPAARSPNGARDASGAAIKPVEAAALLIDLARWGLVLPWRDSLFGQGRHVLPWHIQRQLPPLSGWCPPEGRAAGEPRTRDVRQFISSLHAVWEAIAAERPAVRSAVTAPADEAADGRAAPGNGHPVERRLQSLLQGWPYEPRELQSWAGNRRRAETATQSLSVPPPPFLNEDPSLLAPARLMPGNGNGDEELEFECRLLCEMGLVSIQDGRLEAQREAMARYLRRPVAQQHRDAAQAYLSLLEWSELDLLLRTNPRLLLWRRPYFAIPYEQFRSSLVRLRHLLLRFLACAGEQGWCRLSDVEAALRELWPRFSAALQNERESWFTQAWGLAWRAEGDAPEATEPSSSREAAGTGAPPGVEPAGRDTGLFEPRHHPAGRSPVEWEASQGALLRLMLEGPLYWLGLVELSYRDGRPEAFRLRGLANWIWDRPVAPAAVEGAPEALTIDAGTHSIGLHPGSVAPEALIFLGRIARLERADPERFSYHLHPRAILSAFESGASLADLLAEWDRVMPQAIPGALRETLSGWWARYGQVRLYEGFGLLELRDEVTLRELEAGTSLRQHIVARVSPRIVLVRDEAVDGLLKEFAARGYTPKEVD